MKTIVRWGSYGLILAPMVGCANGSMSGPAELGIREFALSNPAQRVGRANSDLKAVLNFDGPSSGSLFTDAAGTVGPDDYVAVVNNSWSVYSKSGALRPGFPKTLASLFAGHPECTLGGFGEHIYEPNVRWDGQFDASSGGDGRGRWIISGAPVPDDGTSTACIAVSQTGDPTGPWYVYTWLFPASDFMRLSVWPNAYYVTTSVGWICALDRVNMLSNNVAALRAPICQEAPDHQHLFAADLDVACTQTSEPHCPTTQLPPQNSPAYAFSLSPALTFMTGTPSNKLNIYSYSVDWNTATGNLQLLTTPAMPLAVDDYLMPCTGDDFFSTGAATAACLPQLATTRQLEANSEFLMHRAAYRRFPDGHESVLLNHTISEPSGSTHVAGVRWYEIRGLNDAINGPSIYQSGEYAPADGNSRFNGGMAMNKDGDIALGFSITGPAMHPGVHYTGWRNGFDPQGIMNQGEAVLVDGGGNNLDQTDQYGEYSQMTVDPADDCTFWYTNMYSTGGAMFARVGSFRFPACAGQGNSPDFSLGVVQPPSTIVAQPLPGGQHNLQYQVTPELEGTSTGLSVQLGLAGLPSGVSASWTPSAIIPTGTTATLTLAATGAVTGPTQTFTITGTSGGIQHAVNADITVIGASVFNGGFESGGFSDHLTGWNSNSMNGRVTAMNTGGPHSGGWYVRLGSPDNLLVAKGHNLITQGLVVPGNPGQVATLNLWYRPSCTDRLGALDSVSITDLAGNPLVAPPLSNCTSTDVWTPLSVVLSDANGLPIAKGTPVMLRIEQFNNDSTLIFNLSQLDIDDVSLAVQ